MTQIGNKTLLIAISALLTVGIAFFGIIMLISETNSANKPLIYDERIDVIAKQFEWTFKYEKPVQVGDSTFYNTTYNMYVEVGKTYLLNITSIDVEHGFSVPDLNIKVDAIPGKYNTITLKITEKGRYTIKCFHYCGFGHETMVGEILAS